MTIRWLLYGLTVVALGCSRVLASAGTTTAFTLPAQSYPGSRERQYKVYAPGGLSGPAPMVMALHGCQQTHDDVLRDWGLVAAADRNGFILVTPFITSYDGLRSPNCWGFWLEQHRHQGAGESEDLHQIGLQVESRMSVDPTRRYVVGLSSGGAMAVVLSVTHNEYFAAAASAAGLPYGEDAGAVSSQCPGFAAFHTVGRVVADMRGERDNSSPIPLMVLQNNRDCTVVQPAGRHLRDAHLRINGDAAHNTSAKTRAQQRDCAPFYGAAWGCQHVIYTVDGQAGSRSLVAGRWSKPCSTMARSPRPTRRMRTMPTTGSAARTAATVPGPCSAARATPSSCGTFSGAIGPWRARCKYPCRPAAPRVPHQATTSSKGMPRRAAWQACARCRLAIRRISGPHSISFSRR